MKEELISASKKLEATVVEKNLLLTKLEKTQLIITESKSEYSNHIRKIKMELHNTLDRHKKERLEMQHNYEEQIEEFKRNSEKNEHKFSALLQQYSILQQELTGYLDSSTETSNGARITTTKDMLSAIRELAKSEQVAKQKIKELEKKVSHFVRCHVSYKIRLLYIQII